MLNGKIRWVRRNLEANRSSPLLGPVIVPVDNGTVSVKRARIDLDRGPGWVVRYRNTAVAVHGASEAAVVAGLRWRLARDKTFLTTPMPSPQLDPVG